MPPAFTDPEAPTEAAEQQHKEKILLALAAAAERQRREKSLSAVAAAAAERRRREKILLVAEQQQKERMLSAERQRGENKCMIFAILACVCVVVGLFALLVFVLSIVLPRDPSYSVAIDAVSGLTTNRTDLALDPEFNLTLRVASLSRRYKACVEPGTYLEVAYRCVTLATSATAEQPLCAAPREAAEQQLVATGTRVRVPGAVLDSLAADMRHAELVFQVTIRWSGDKYTDDVFVASCGGRQVGAADHDLGTSCDAWHFCPNTKNDGSH